MLFIKGYQKIESSIGKDELLSLIVKRVHLFIRISTLHSSKGLDFSIVLLLLHRSPFTGRIFDNDTLEKMKRNLIYVSLTRAMDHVNVFVLDGESKVEIGDLVEVFDETTGFREFFT